MEKFISRVACVCCGEHVTKPVFIDGVPYGSYCAKKITGRAQAGKTAISLQVVSADFLFHTVMFNEKKYKVAIHPLRKDAKVIHFIIDYKKQNTCPLTKAIIEHALWSGIGEPSDTLFDVINRYVSSL